MLNTILIFHDIGKGNQHKEIVWETFTDHIINFLNARNKSIPFILLGEFAKMKKSLVTNRDQNGVIEEAYPGYLKKVIISTNLFSRVNPFLEEKQLKKNDWQIENI